MAVIVAGCGDDSENDAAPAATTPAATTTSRATAGYVAEVNRLCAELEPKVLDIAGPHPGSFPIKAYEAERPKRAALYEAFDAKVEAIPVSAGDRSAADAFDAFRRLSDATDARLAAAAATGEQDRFDAAIEARHRTFDTRSELKDLAAAGIVCNAR
jgi:crotonobetainyl-CoA:carnitine CoA-transferase CaiB-like acyl-CoA transferase